MELSDKISRVLCDNANTPLRVIADKLFKPARDPRKWSRRRVENYHAISGELQRMQLAGVVKFVGGKGAGWRLA